MALLRRSHTRFSGRIHQRTRGYFTFRMDLQAKLYLAGKLCGTLSITQAQKAMGVPGLTCGDHERAVYVAFGLDEGILVGSLLRRQCAGAKLSLIARFL